jgi:lambda family phage portal protein
MGFFSFLRSGQSAAVVPRVEPVLPMPKAPDGAAARAAAGRRNWLAASSSRLLADLPGGAATAPNQQIRTSLKVLRARSRWLAQNDGYSKGFLRLLRRNVVGPNGFGLQMAVPLERDAKRRDEDANSRIEKAWNDWAGVGSCDATRRLSFTTLSQLLLTCIARDGEAIVRKVRGGKWNRAGLALQVLDPSQLEEDLNIPFGAGGAYGYAVPRENEVRMGVERDAFGCPVAYHLRTVVPNDDTLRYGDRLFQRVPASEIIHLFVTDWPDQVRGIPWLEAGIRALAMMDGYTEAELVASRAGAGKMGFYKLQAGADPTDLPAGLEQDGRLVQEAEPGTFELLPQGIDVSTFDPQHPSTAFKEFCSAILRHAASGTGLSYNAFANDPASLNYSGLRATALEDHEEYRTIQGWLIGSLCRPLFTDWLTGALLAGVTGLPAAKFERFNSPQFTPRGWQWVDPQNEITAAREAVALGITSRHKLAAEQGVDLDQVIADLRAEQEAMHGLEPPPVPSSYKPQPKEGANNAGA